MNGNNNKTLYNKILEHTTVSKSEILKKNCLKNKKYIYKKSEIAK